MTVSKRVHKTPAGVRLCTLDTLGNGKARNFVLQMRNGRFHGFIVWEGDGIAGYVDSCPHSGLPLAQELDAYLTPDGTFIACSWHGALFRKQDGLCVAGPCTGQSLASWPVRIDDGWIVTI
ncbi:MAG: Rieske (2Fe-2S) protein [Sphingobium sp.]